MSHNFFLLDLFLILSFLPELTVKQGESSQSKTGQNSWLPALIDSTETLILKDNTLVSGESLSRESFKKTGSMHMAARTSREILVAYYI